MKRPTTDQIETAIAWLESNEGDGPEAAACQTVAAMLSRMVESRIIHEHARESGISVRTLRKAIKDKRMEVA